MKSRISLPTWMAIGMALGIVAGIVLPDLQGVYKPLGDLFIKLIRMVVVPLVLCTIIAGASSVCELTKLVREATNTLVY